MTQTHPGCIGAAGAVSCLLNGGRNMKIRKHLDGHHENRSNVYKMLVWQMDAGTAFPHGEEYENILSDLISKVFSSQSDSLILYKALILLHI